MTTRGTTRCYRRDGGVRGVLSISDRDRSIARQLAEGTPSADLARQYGVSRPAIWAVAKRVREAESDARNAAARQETETR